MQFVVTPVVRAHDVVLQVAGELDVATVATLGAAVDKALAEQPGKVLLDLAPARFIDSTGCRELVRSAKKGSVSGVTIEVVAPPGNWRVRRVLELVQLSSVLLVHDELPDP